MIYVIIQAWIALLLFCSSVSYAQEQLTLSAALKRCRENNIALRAARFEPEFARADVMSAGLYPNPTFTISTMFIPSAKYLQDGTSSLDDANRQDAFQLGQEIITAGKLEQRVAFAEKNVLVRQYSYKELERNILTQTALQWLNVAFQKTSLQIIRDVRAVVDSLVVINRVRLRNEAITEIDLKRTEIIAEQLAFQEQNTQQSLQNERVILRQLVNMPQSVDTPTNDSLFQTSDARLAVVLDSLVGRTLLSRPDLQAAQVGVEAASLNARLQDALAFPNVSAGILWNPQNLVPYIGLSVGIPIPLFDRNQGEIQKSHLQEQQALATVETLRQQVGVDVSVTYQTYRQQQQNLTRIERVLTNSQQVLAAVRYNYLRGNTTIIDFLEAQRTFYDAQSSYNEASFNLKRSLVQLYSAIGLITTLGQ